MLQYHWGIYRKVWNIPANYSNETIKMDSYIVEDGIIGE
jgi:hypothetical protein